MAAPRILVVDDEPSLVVTLRYALTRAGFDVATAGDGPAALEAVRSAPPDLVLLDVMLPGLDGFEVCRRIRAFAHVPVVMLTSRDDPVDRVVGLEVGADDYVTKPFSIRELVARAKAHLRREAMLRGEATQIEQSRVGETLVHGGIQVDVPHRRATLDGRPLTLKRREFDLLAHLCRNPRVVLSRSRLLTEVWRDEIDSDSRTVDVHVRRLRRHLERDARNPEYLHTVRGAGYQLRHVPRAKVNEPVPPVNRAVTKAP